MTLHAALHSAFVHHFSGGVVQVDKLAGRQAQASFGAPTVVHPSPRSIGSATCTTRVVHVVLRCKLLTCTNAAPHGQCPT